MKDLFTTPGLLPNHIKAILDKFNMAENDYENCELLLTEMEENGYTFEFGLDAEPYNLRKMFDDKDRLIKAKNLERKLRNNLIDAIELYKSRKINSLPVYFENWTSRILSIQYLIIDLRYKTNHYSTK